MEPPTVLKCRDVTEISTDYMENALPWPRRAGMLFHLAYCSACRAYMAQLEKTVALLRRGTLPAPSPETEAHLLANAGKPAE